MSLWEDNKDVLFKEVSGNSCVHCAEGIVQEVDIGIVVEDPCQVYPCLLPPTQGHTSLSHQCQITIHKLSNILEGDGEETGRDGEEITAQRYDQSHFIARSDITQMTCST